MEIHIWIDEDGTVTVSDCPKDFVPMLEELSGLPIEEIISRCNKNGPFCG